VIQLKIEINGDKSNDYKEYCLQFYFEKNYCILVAGLEKKDLTSIKKLIEKELR